MRWNLKTFLLLTIGLGICFGWYEMRRQAEIGLEIPVPQPLGLDDEYEVPDKLLEIRSWAQVGLHDQQFEDRVQLELDNEIARIRENVSWFRPNHDSELWNQRPEELVQIALSHLNAQTDFHDLVSAAWILQKAERPEGLRYIKKRFLENRIEDQKYHWELLNVFQSVDSFREDEAVLSHIMKEASRPASPIHRASAHFLFEQQVDSEPLKKVYRKIAASGGNGEYDALCWLLENDQAPETMQLALEHVRNNGGIELAEIARKSNDPTNVQINRLVDQLAVDAIAHLIEQVRRPRDPLARDDERRIVAWRLLGWQKHESAIEFLSRAEAILRNEEMDVHCAATLAICSALVEAGRVDEASDVLIRQISKTYQVKNYRGESVNAFCEMRDELYQLAEKILGKEKTKEICLQQLALGDDCFALNQLVAMYRDTFDESLVDSILDAAGKPEDAPSSHRPWILRQVRKIGTRRLKKLWKTVPRSAIKNGSHKDRVKFYHDWAMKDIKRQDLIDWINKTLKPKQKLTEALVMKNPRFPGDHWAWYEVCYDHEEPHVEIDTDLKFAMIALAHSGRGCMTFNDRYPLESLTDVMVGEIANIESKEFQATSYFDNSVASRGGKDTQSFVVNGRLYQFEHSGPGSSDDRYSAEAAIQILNAVAIRQHLKGRFLCFTRQNGTTN